jgi:hypothetical protein
LNPLLFASVYLTIITLTKVPQPPDRPGQAGVNEGSSCEVTPEMIREGVAVLNAHISEEYRVIPDEYLVEMIYTVMFHRHHAPHGSG